MVSQKCWTLLFQLFIWQTVLLEIILAKPQVEKNLQSDKKNNNNNNNNSSNPNDNNINNLFNDDNDIDPQKSFLFMRQGNKEVALGPTNLFFPNRVPFLIPLGTDEDEEEMGMYDYGEYTTELDDAKINQKKTQDKGVSLAPIFLDMNPKSKTKQNQAQPDQEPDFSIDAAAKFESSKIGNSSAKKSKEDQTTAKPRKLSGFRENQKNNKSKFPETEQIHTTGNKKNKTGGSGLDPDFSIDAADGSSNGSRRNPAESRPNNRPGSKLSKYQPDPEPEFEVSSEESGDQKPATEAPERPTTSYLSASVSLQNNHFVPDLEPDFSVPFVDGEDVQQRPVSPTPSKTTTTPIPALDSIDNQHEFITESEPDFAVSFGPNKDGPSQQKPVPSTTTQLENNANKFVPELEPDFSLPFGPNDQLFPSQQRPLTSTPPFPTTIQTTPPSADNDQNQFVSDLEPDLSVPFGPNDQSFSSQQRPTTPVPTRPATTQNPSLDVSTNQNKIVPDLEPDFSVPFGPNNHLFLAQQRPVTITPLKPSTVQTAPPSTGNNQNQFVPDLEPDFSVPFGPNDQFFPPQQRPVTSDPPRPSVIETRPPSAGNSQNQFVPDLEPDFSVPFGPNEQFIAVQQRPVTSAPPRPSVIETRPPSTGNSQNQFVSDLEPDVSVSFGPNEQIFPTQQRPVIPAEGGNNQNQFVEEQEPDFSVPFGPSETGPLEQKPVTTSPLSTTTESSFAFGGNQNQFVTELEPDFSVPFGVNEAQFPQRPPPRPVTAPGQTLFVPEAEPEFALPFNPLQDNTVTALPATVQRPEQGFSSGIAFPAEVDFPKPGQGIATLDNGQEIVRNNETGMLDFSHAPVGPDGRRCLNKTDYIESVVKEPVVECIHKKIEKCHYTYVTQFNPVQEEICDENFEKLCQITFNTKSVREIVQKCYRPLKKVCNGTGPEACQTVFETACTTKYVPKQNGTNHVGETSCEKLPVKICGPGCKTVEEPEVCHEKEVDTILSVPEEVCDLNPHKICRKVTKMVPKLKPKHECTLVPKEFCNVRLGIPKTSRRPLQSLWCLDETLEVDNSGYDDNNGIVHK